MLENYNPPLWLPDGHTQSIYPSVFRYGGPIEERPLLIVSHGLEGSSDRQYVTGLINKMKGMNALAWNYRSCSGEPNKNLRFYHSGATDDLDFIIQLAIERGAKDIYLAGFSLGGNLTLKWLGEQGKNPPEMIRKAVAFSVPLHLSSSSKQLAKRENRLYTHRFLQTLIKKVKEKSARYPQDITVEMIDSVKSLVDFDNVITGPLHGFKDGEDYYEKSSSLYFLDRINVPTLIVNAKNDPFLSAECIPEDYVKTLDFVQLDAQEKGGHCGFYPKNYQGYTWSENRAELWFKKSV
jgi:uncharacterized protein